MEPNDGHYTIPQAAKYLKVTEKTIRNYIDRALLGAEKWNGQWRIPESAIIEIYEKKFGKKRSFKFPEVDDFMRISQGEYAEQQKKLGQLEVDEGLIVELKGEIKALHERLIQLEASAASGWTEARNAKEDLKIARESLEKAVNQTHQAQEEIGWLRRELESLRKESATSHRLIKTLERRNAELFEQAHHHAIGGEE